MTKPVVCFFTSVLSHSKKYLNVSSRNRVEEKVRLRHTQPTNCTMQLHNAQCIVQHTQSTYVQCKNNNLVQCAECITMQDTHAHNCIVPSALCALCIVQSQSSVVWRLWQDDLQVRGSFLPSLSLPVATSQEADQVYSCSASRTFCPTFFLSGVFVQRLARNRWGLYF